jgi:hypothetical protein
MLLINFNLHFLVYLEQPVHLHYIAHVAPLHGMFKLLPGSDLLPDEANDEKCLSGLGVSHTGQFNFEPSAPTI